MFRDWLRTNILYVCMIIGGGIFVFLGVVIDWRQLILSGGYLIGWTLAMMAYNAFWDWKRKKREAKNRS